MIGVPSPEQWDAFSPKYRSTIKNFEIDQATNRAWIDGKNLGLSPKEFEIFVFMLSRAEKISSKKDLMKHIYGNEWQAKNQKIIGVFMRYIRAKIEEATGGENYIETIWGRGYVLRLNPITEEQVA